TPTTPGIETMARTEEGQERLTAPGSEIAPRWGRPHPITTKVSAMGDRQGSGDLIAAALEFLLRYSGMDYRAGSGWKFCLLMLLALPAAAQTEGVARLAIVDDRAGERVFFLKELQCWIDSAGDATF